MKLILFIGSLRTGGAERQMLNLARGLAARDHEVTVLSLYPSHVPPELLSGPPIAFSSLFRKEPEQRLVKMLQLVLAPLRLKALIRKEVPDVLYSMLYLTNLVARLATRRGRAPPLIWGLRASNLIWDWRRAIPFYLCKYLAGGVDLVISNSQRGLEFHKESGFRIKNAEIIPNGIDSEAFNFDLSGRNKIRQDWGLSADQILIGLVGRFDPHKGHDIFIEAAALLSREFSHLRFACIGPGEGETKEHARELVRQLGLQSIVRMEGGRSDLPSVYSAIDIAVSSSWGEGFSNVIGEAMSCSRPCVVTDVGDSAKIVGNTCRVVRPGDAKQLAEGIRALILQGADRNEPGRQRIIDMYSVQAMVRDTASRMMAIMPPDARMQRDRAQSES